MRRVCNQAQMPDFQGSCTIISSGIPIVVLAWFGLISETSSTALKLPIEICLSRVSMDRHARMVVDMNCRAGVMLSMNLLNTTVCSRNVGAHCFQSIVI